MKYLFTIITLSILTATISDEEYPYLTNFIGSECDSLIFSADSIESKILKFYQSENGLIQITLEVGDNCGAVKNGMLEVKGDTLNLLYDGINRFKTIINPYDTLSIEIEHVFEAIASCDCLFELYYEIQGIPGDEYIYTLNGELLR
jgi:hypothetical protein